MSPFLCFTQNKCSCGPDLSHAKSTHLPTLRRPFSCQLLNIHKRYIGKKYRIPQAGLNGTAPVKEGASFGNSEKLIDLSEILSEARALSSDLVFEDFDPDEAPWQPPPPMPEEAVLPAAAEPPAADPAIGGVQVPLNPLLQPSAYSPEQGFRELTVHEVYGKIEAGEVALVLDVREPDELMDYGTIAGALNIPLGRLSTAVKSGQLDAYKSAPVVAICAAGIRSAQATVRLTKVLGFHDVSNMQGGVYAWLDAGLPLQQTS